MPVYHESIDDVVGVIHQKDLFSARYHHRTELSPWCGQCSTLHRAPRSTT